MPPQSALFVGDNPEKDGRGARGVGMSWVRVARQEDRPPVPALADNFDFEVTSKMVHGDRSRNEFRGAIYRAPLTTTHYALSTAAVRRLPGKAGKDFKEAGIRPRFS
jgi:hypothetical protein